MQVSSDAARREEDSRTSEEFLRKILINALLYDRILSISKRRGFSLHHYHQQNSFHVIPGSSLLSLNSPFLAFFNLEFSSFVPSQRMDRKKRKMHFYMSSH
jgi:hypothetical protein